MFESDTFPRVSRHGYGLVLIRIQTFRGETIARAAGISKSAGRFPDTQLTRRFDSIARDVAGQVGRLTGRSAVLLTFSADGAIVAEYLIGEQSMQSEIVRAILHDPSSESVFRPLIDGKATPLSRRILHSRIFPGLGCTAVILAPAARAVSLAPKVESSLSARLNDASIAFLRRKIERTVASLERTGIEACSSTSERELLDSIGGAVCDMIGFESYIQADSSVELAQKGVAAASNRFTVLSSDNAPLLEFAAGDFAVSGEQRELLEAMLSPAVRSLADHAGEDAGSSSRFQASLLRAIDIVGRSADPQTLKYALSDALCSLFGRNYPNCWWSVENDSAKMEFCNYPDGQKPTHGVVHLSDDSLFALAAGNGHFLFVEDEGLEPAAATFEDSPRAVSRLLMAIRHGSTPVSFLVFSFPGHLRMNGQMLGSIEILARHGNSRMEALAGSMRLHIERRLSSFMDSHISKGRIAGTSHQWANDYCTGILSAFPDLTCAAYLVRKSTRYHVAACAARSVEECDIQAPVDISLARLIVKGGRGRVAEGEGGWSLLSAITENIPEGSGRCDIFSSGAGVESILLLFSAGSPNESLSDQSIEPWLRVLSTVEKASAETTRQSKGDAFSAEFMDRLEKYRLSGNTRDSASLFMEPISFATGADRIIVFLFDENSKMFTSVSDWPPGEGHGLSEISMQQADLLGPFPREDGCFTVRFDGATRSSWAQMVQDDSLSMLRVVVVSEGKKLAGMMLLGYRDADISDACDEKALLRASRTVFNLITASKSLSATMRNSQFSSGFLRIMAQALRQGGDGGWSEVEQIANRLCALAGGVMQLDFAFLFFSSLESHEQALMGSWSRHTYGEIPVASEAAMIVKSPENGGEWRGSRRLQHRSVLSRDDFPLFASFGVKHAIVLEAGRGENTVGISMVLVSAEPLPEGYETEMALTAMESTRLIIENRLRQMDVDWTLRAMRSELAVANNLSSTFEMQSLLNGTLKEVAEFLGCDLSLVELIGEKGDCSVASIFPASGVENSFSPAPVQVEVLQREEHGRGLSFLVAETGSKMLIQGSAACDQLLSYIPPQERSIIHNAAGGKPVSSLCAAPISFAGKLLGLLLCMRTGNRSGFRKSEANYIESVAALVSTAIENSRNVESTFKALSKLKKLDTLRSNFSSIAAHELRTPLTSIKVYIELMKSGKVGKFSEQEMRNIENLLASVSELNDITNNMLEFTRMEAMLLETEMSPISLQPVVEEMCAQLSPAANVKSIKLELEADKVLKQVRANAPLARRVINNLIANAIKFTPEGGRVSVRLKDDREGVLFVVEDTGRGIPAEDLPFIFDRFHVVDSSILRSRTGFRLGLPISKLIVERHGGKIWADSEFGKGSKFYVLLPVMQGISTEEWLSRATNYIH